MSLIPAVIHRRIAHRPNLVKIVDNIGWLFFDKVLRMGVGLLVGVWVARYLGPEQYGVLNFALAVTGMFGAIAGLGLQGIVVRDIVRDPESARLTLGTAAVLQLAGGFAAFLLALAAIAYLRPDDALARSIVAILGAMMLFKASESAVYWFESQVQSKYTVLVQNTVFLVFAVIKVALIVNQAPLTAFVWAMLVEAATTAFILIAVMGLCGPALNSLRASYARAKFLLKDSWPLVFSGITIMIYTRIDQVMLGQMLGDEVVGVYSAALRISEVWYFIPTTIAASVFPSILQAKKQSEESYLMRLQKLYDLMVLISIGIAVPMTILAKPLVILLYGDEYAVGGTVLMIHIWGSLFMFLGVASGKWFLAEGRQLLTLQRHAVGALVNVIFNFMLIPRFGAVGAASATVAAMAFSSYLYDVSNKHTRPMFWMKTKSLCIINPLMNYWKKPSGA